MPRHTASGTALLSAARPPRLVLGFLPSPREPCQVPVVPPEEHGFSREPFTGKPTRLGHAFGGEVAHHHAEVQATDGSGLEHIAGQSRESFGHVAFVPTLLIEQDVANL